MKKIEWKRNCPNSGSNPNCKKVISYSRKRARNSAEKRNTKCKSCSRKGIKFSDEHKKKISDNHSHYWNDKKRKSFTEETRKRMSESASGKSNSMYGKMPWNKGKTNVYSKEMLKRMRLSAIKRIENMNGQIMPNYNSEGCKHIDEYNKKYGFNFQHAENGGEVCIDGYWPDGLDKKRKTIIEIDEKYHFNPDGTYKEKDIKRQQYLENLGYDFIRVRK